MTTRVRTIALAAVAWMFVGCAGPEGPTGSERAERSGDDRFSSFLGEGGTGGKADGAGPSAAEARAVLQVANESTEHELDDDARLDTRAAAHIVAYRRGPDDRAGTADDETFDDLRELDAVSWVGDRAYGKMLEYARRLGYVEAHRDVESYYGVAAGSEEAAGILDLVETASETQLDEDVELDERAAASISEYRAGPDGTLGSSDDRNIDDLAELAARKWVADRAFGKLLEFAKHHGFIAVDTIHGIAVGSAAADGILAVSNQLSKDELDDAVALDVRAAEHIVAYRRGDDGSAGTDDDRRLETLVELNGLSWVASRAFSKLHDYAKANGYVEGSTCRRLSCVCRQEGESCSRDAKCCDGSCDTASGTCGASTDPQPACDASASPFGGGDGTEAAPYRICSVAQLKRLDDRISYLDDHFELWSDLDLGGATNFEGLSPVRAEPFRGSFDGRNHTIDALTIDRPAGDAIGLFRHVTKATIQNVELRGVDIHGDIDVGAVVGRFGGADRATLRNVRVSGRIEGDETVGGIVGTNYGRVVDSRVLGSSSKIVGQVAVGGAAGENHHLLDGTTSSARVEAVDGPGGGLVGRQRGGITVDGVATGDVSIANVDEGGGLVGKLAQDSAVRESMATGTVDAADASDVGGLAGYVDDTSSVADSYALGDATGDHNVGGLVGTHDGAIRRCYAFGAPSGAGDVGGLVGAFNNDATVDSAYWNTDASGGTTTSSAGTGLRATSFTQKAHFVGWDFDGVWKMGANRPRLR